MKENKRILIFNVNWLGDVLFSTATIRNVRHNFPGSFIACVIPRRCYSILEGNPFLNEIIIFDEKAEHKNILARLSFIKSLKNKKFDTVFLLHRSFTRALICRLADISERIGYYTRKRGFLLTQNIPQPKKDTLHRIDYYLNIIEKSGLKVKDRHLDFFTSDQDLAFVDDLLGRSSVDKNDFLIAINPGGNWLLKRWPKEYWARLADELIGRLHAKVVITGSNNDLPLVSSIQKLMRQKPIIVSGLLNIKELAALTKRAHLFITADTGPLHIANAVGAKNIIVVFGPTSQQVTGPYPSDKVISLQKDVGCQIPCYKVNCKDNRCMKAVLPEDVIGQIEALRKNINK